MARKFREQIDIKLDNKYNKITNKETIIQNIELVDNQEELNAVLEYFLRIFETIPTIDKQELKEIVTAIKTKENSLTNDTATIQKQFNDIKQENNNLKNISIVDTSKHDNDKINGFKKNVIYIEIERNGKKELYEVIDMDAIKNILNNKEILKSLSETEIINLLIEHSKNLESSYIETSPNDKLTSDSLNEEINRISDTYVKDAFLKEENLVLQERIEIKKYVDQNCPGAKIEYGLNSYGERIYMIENKIIKFRTMGDIREMQVLDKEEKLENASEGNFQKYSEFDVGEKNIELEEHNAIKDFANDNSMNTLNKTIEAISIDIPISENQIDFLKRFLKTYMIEYSKLNSDIPGELSVIFDKYYEYAKNNDKFLNEEIREILQKKEIIDRRKQIEKENKKVLQLTPIEKAGFISVAIILEASVIIGGIVAILALVKK